MDNDYDDALFDLGANEPQTETKHSKRRYSRVRRYRFRKKFLT